MEFFWEEGFYALESRNLGCVGESAGAIGPPIE
jgi:hypothetical protein